MSRSYLMGGKLGDFIHSLVICKYIFDTTGEKADIYISNIGHEFETPLEFTFNELKPVLEKQSWVNSFSLYTNQNINVNLNLFRDSKFLYSTNWIQVYFNTFLNDIRIPMDYSWIDVPENDDYKNILLVNRSPRHALSLNSRLQYEKYADEFKDSAYFMCFHIYQFDQFPLKDKFKLLKVDTLYQMFQAIKSCKLYIGNQSAPSAIATSLDVLRKIELLDGIDSIHYVDDYKFYSNFSSF